jgi:hypothetical protein
MDKEDLTMSTTHLKGVMAALLFGLLATHPGATSAEHPSGYVVSNGMTVYLGIMPVNALRKHPEALPKDHPLPSGKNLHHVLVAIFDSATGERVTEAEVEARISPLGLAGLKKPMHPSAAAGQLTFCNFFTLSPGDTYVIRVDIRRPGTPSVATAEFTRRFPRVAGGVIGAIGPRVKSDA